MPAGRLAIQGGGSPGGGAGSGTPGLSPSRMKVGMSCSTGSPSSRSNSSQSACLRGAQIPASRPGGIEQRQARDPLGSGSGERERGRSPARVPDEMKPVPAVCVRLAQHAVDLDVEAVVLGRLGRCVDLEILCDRLNARAERGDESAVRRLCREHNPRKQDHPKRGQSRHFCHIRARRASESRSASRRRAFWSPRRCCVRPRPGRVPLHVNAGIFAPLPHDPQGARA